MLKINDICIGIKILIILCFSQTAVNLVYMYILYYLFKHATSMHYLCSDIIIYSFVVNVYLQILTNFLRN